MKKRPRIGAFPQVKRAKNSKIPGVSYDASIWEDVIKYFTTKHNISEYDFNRIICLSFDSWGARKHINATSKKSREYQLSKENKDKYAYSINSEGILDSLMAWKDFVKMLDGAIRYLKPQMNKFDELWSSIKEGLLPRKEKENIEDITSLIVEDSFLTENSTYADLNNILYGEYDDDSNEQ